MIAYCTIIFKIQKHINTSFDITATPLIEPQIAHGFVYVIHLSQFFTVLLQPLSKLLLVETQIKWGGDNFIWERIY